MKTLEVNKYANDPIEIAIFVTWGILALVGFIWLVLPDM